MKRSNNVKNINSLVVADKKMYEYYKNDDLETYLLTVMNMVVSACLLNF